MSEIQISLSRLVPSIFHLAECDPAAPMASDDGMEDLQLSRWIRAISDRHGGLDIGSYLRSPAATVEEANYRQGVFRDLRTRDIRRAVGDFLLAMDDYDEFAARAVEQASELELARYQLTAVSAYCTGLRDLCHALRRCPDLSAAFASLADYLSTYTSSEGFLAMANRALRLEEQLCGLRYGLRLGVGYVTVEPTGPDENYAAVVTEVFARFRVGDAKDYRTKYQVSRHLNGLEERILMELADEHKELFEELTRFTGDYADPVDPVIAQVRSEASFYAAIFDLEQESQHLGQPWCLPDFIGGNEATVVTDAADVALLYPAMGDPTRIVRNDLDKTASERLVVITGPNQAGKTTFARIWGQLHVLARVGCPVPARSARLPMIRLVDTHFERAEKAGTQRGKLKDDLVRIREIVERAGPDTLVILNELFASTTTDDAIDLSHEILDRLMRRGATIICVTFLWELAEQGKDRASWVGNIDGADPRKRTYRVRRGAPEGRAHTEALAASYGLTQEQLRERLAR